MAKRNYKVLFYGAAPEARPFAGTDVTVRASTEKDEIQLHMSRQHATALRDSLNDALRTLDNVNREPTT